MQITSIEQVKSLELGQILYHVSALSCGSHNQHEVTIKSFAVLGVGVKNDNIVISSVVTSYDGFLTNKDQFFQDLIGHDSTVKELKFLTDSKEEAITFLKRVRGGEFTDKVKAFHDAIFEEFERI